jgi:GPH family glycoside/pentoside/hexuronide:cation symporter
LATLASKSSLFFYGFGNLSPAIKSNFLGAPIFYYYNNVLGLDAWLVSLALAVALVIDGISDPVLGYMSDYTKSRWGRRHPYIYGSILPGALSYFLLIVSDFGPNQIALFFQLLILITALRLAWTFYQVPREALGAEISKDYHQRNQLHGLNSAFGWIGGAGVAYATSAWFLGDSYDNLAGYHSLAHWGAAGILIFGAIFAIGSHKEIKHLEGPREDRPHNLRAIGGEIMKTLNHRSWLMLFFSGIVFSIYVGLTSGLTFYFNSFFWEWKPSDVAIFAIVDLLGAIVISGFAGRLAYGWDKKRLAVTLFSVAIVIGPILLILRLLDLWYGIHILPPNGPKYGPLWWIMLGHSFVQAGVAVLAWILVGSMTADVVEDSQMKTGKRSEGLFFAGPHIIQKSISGLGLMIKGIVLTLVGFNPAGTAAEKVAAIEGLAAVMVVLAVVMPWISLWIFSRYQITRDIHDGNLESLGYTERRDDAAREGYEAAGGS